MNKVRASLTAAILSATAAVMSVPTASADDAAMPSQPIVELRQYKIVAGKRDEFVTLFEREFIETQEAEGMTLLGQFKDVNDPDRFVWIRSFPDMPSRLKSLTDFYTGPVWQKHRGTANPMLDDNDNVFLLRPAKAGHGFPPRGVRAGVGASAPKGSAVVATIYHLWKTPDEGFSSFFNADVRPSLEAAGMPVLASFTPTPEANNFPRLPVRTGEKVFIWFSRFDNWSDYTASQQRLRASAGWKNGTEARLQSWLERSPQVLLLEPTPRSSLR